ncbi:MAG: histidine phosphatase family protein, partial [Actinomycetota bacterium]
MRRVLTLIRHGRVDFDARDAFRETPRGRQWDPPLGVEGREQALLLAARLEAPKPFAAIWCSPFRRCV